MRFKNLLPLISIVFLPLATTGADLKAQSDNAKVNNHAEYRVTFSAEKPEVAHVRARLILKQQTLKMLPWGHPWLPDGWATFVHNMEVQDAAGSDIGFSPVKEDGWGSWNVDAEDGAVLYLNYEVHFEHDQYDWNSAGGQDSRPAYSNRALFLISRALFIYTPHGVETATIHLDTPSAWKLAVPWPQLEDRPGYYFAESFSSLVSNVLVLGEFQKQEIEDGNMSIVLAVDNILSGKLEEFRSTFQKQLAEYRRIFHGTPEVIYIVAIRGTDEIDGESFHNSFSQIVMAERIDQRKIIWSNVLGHELFHFWNGNYFLVGKEKSEIEWFGEGFTEYFASRTLLRTGLIDESTYFNKLARYFYRYHIAKKMWPLDPVSLVNAGQAKSTNWLYLYGGGAKLALILDIKILSDTKGRKGLEDVMLLLKEKFGDFGIPIVVADIQNAVNEVSGADYTDFFTRYVYGADDMPNIEDVMNTAGISVDQYGDEFYVRKAGEPSGEQHMIYDALTRGGSG
jgi:predicted metalloprotease with PDZ domain